MGSLLYRLWASFLACFRDLYFAFDHPAVKAVDIRKLERIAMPGDIVLRRYVGYADNYFIP